MPWIETRGALSFTASYAYDLSGNVTSITLPSGRTLTYGLDRNGQINSVNADIGGTGTILADAITYLPFGGMEELTYGNGIALANTYNTAYQLTDRHIGSLINDNYSYDAAGNIIVKGTASYGYDPLYRLLNENSNAGLFDYSYDAIGNRLTEGKNGSSTGYIYPFDSSKLSAINATPVTYDAAGNIITDVQRSYTIDAAGRVQDVTISGAIAGSYVYNANNQRTSKTVNGSTTHYVYGLGGQLYGEYDSSGNLIREYAYLNGEPLAQIDSGENTVYLHTDHLRTPRVATDSSASPVWHWQSDAFGNGTPTGSTTVNLRFVGQYYDDESGLHYNWNRYYDPKTGRYITSDPIGLDGGLNTYTYVNANPVMFNDPEGLQLKEPSIPCPGFPPRNNPNFQPYDLTGNPNIFHCGREGHNQVDPPIGHKGQQCFYDQNGCLIGNHHVLAACKGTPDSAPASDWYNHFFKDILTEEAWKAFLKSQHINFAELTLAQVKFVAWLLGVSLPEKSFQKPFYGCYCEVKFTKTLDYNEHLPFMIQSQRY
ncbi:MAG: hypothetical protein KDF59_15525 [Nitrosomonas sp.]|nr:hypothetical protein [Nitrosomonas sp.]